MDDTNYQNRRDEMRTRFEEKARRMESHWERRARYRGHGRRHGRAWTGLFLLVIGGLLFARQAGVVFPVWFFTWPVFLIGLGFWIGARHRFSGFGWMVPILIGGAFLLQDIFVQTPVRHYIWPVALIALGLYFILRPRRHFRGGDFGADGPATGGGAPAPVEGEVFENDGADRLDVTAIFGGVKKNILTKNFKGGEIMTFMGGAEINLAQADFEGRIKIDCTNIFGGTKLIIPPDWEIQSDIVAIFGGVDDKRPPAVNPMPNKIIVLDGTCLFGGVEIRSYY